VVEHEFRKGLSVKCYGCSRRARAEVVIQQVSDSIPLRRRSRGNLTRRPLLEIAFAQTAVEILFRGVSRHAALLAGAASRKGMKLTRRMASETLFAGARFGSRLQNHDAMFTPSSSERIRVIPGRASEQPVLWYLAGGCGAAPRLALERVTDRMRR
jgi:hypothetical protein